MSTPLDVRNRRREAQVRLKSNFGCIQICAVKIAFTFFLACLQRIVRIGLNLIQKSLDSWKVGQSSVRYKQYIPALHLNALFCVLQAAVMAGKKQATDLTNALLVAE